jgi:hypothetical protein
MRTRGEVAVKLMWAALIGFMAVGIAQGWGVSQIVVGLVVVAVVVFGLDRWARR